MEKENVYLLSSEQFYFYWPRIEQGLFDIEFFDYYKPQTVFDRCLKGAMQCWALSNGEIQLIIVSEIIHYDTGKVLRFIAAFGTGIDRYLEAAKDVFPRVARSQGCTGYEVIGRDGWGKKLKPLGFKRRFTVFYRPVDLEREH